MVIEIFGGFALFASAISLNKLILVWLAPSFFVGIRRITAGFILFTYKAWKSPHLRFCYIKPDLVTLIMISVMTMFVPSILKAYGFKYLVSSKAALIGSLDPFVTALYAYFLWNEKLTRAKLLGMLIAFFGIVFLITSTSSIEETIGGWWILSLPELAVFASMAISRFGWIMARKVLKSERYSPSELNSLNMIISGACALATAYFLAVCDFCIIPPTWTFIALFSYSVLIGDILCYNIYGYLLKKYSIVLLSLCGLSIPLFVHLLGPFIHGEPITAHFFISLALVLMGTFIFYRDNLTKTQKARANSRL